jgi:hypothetical protein
MKKYFLTLLLALGFFATATLSASKSDAHYFLAANGLYYGNICRIGIYWQQVNYQLVGSQCYSPGWNAFGRIVFE